jgi:cytochrome c oxidase cbb3-type subunit 3
MIISLNRSIAVAALLFAIFFYVTPAFTQGVDAKLIYKTYCTQCHGLNGSGKGINTQSMSVQPRDHTDPKGMSAISDAQLKKAIAKGGLSVSKSVLMPPWGATFNNEELDSLVSYLRELCKCSERD